MGTLSERSSSEVEVNFKQTNFKQSWGELRAKLGRTSSEVGADFERSWGELRAKLGRTSSEVFFAKFASKWKHFSVPTVKCQIAVRWLLGILLFIRCYLGRGFCNFISTKCLYSSNL